MTLYQQSTVFVVRSGTAETNPTDSTFNFKSLNYINMMWALHRNTLSTFQSLYSITLLHLWLFNLLLYVEESWERYMWSW